MNKRMTGVVSFLLAGLLLSNASFAQYPDAENIAQECRHTADLLERLAESQSSDPCSGDLKIAAAYIEATGLKLYHQKIKQALTSIKYGELELKEISNTRAYCAHFSTAVKPIIANVIMIGSEIEVLERLTPLSHKTP